MKSSTRLTPQLLKVTAEMLDGRIATTDGYLPLDGILYAGYAKLYRPDLLGVPMVDLSEAETFPLPLEVVNEGTDDWYYNCSFAMYEVLGEDRRFFNKRYDFSLAEKYSKANVVETKKGKFKNWRIPLDIVLTAKVEWYCTGNKEKLIEILGCVKNIGKKSSQGLGAIKRWIVEEANDDFTHLRPVPDECGEDEMTIRPLYFDINNERKVKVMTDARLGCVALYERW